MVLLVASLTKLYNKLETHHHFHFHLRHHESEALSASLQAFLSDVSCFLNHYLSIVSKPGSSSQPAGLSLSLFHQCFELLPVVSKAFGKLVLSIDHPLSKWEAASVEDYLSYTLYLLELLNSISSSVSHLSQTRLELSHALALVETSPAAATEHLKAIDHLSTTRSIQEKSEDGDEEKSVCSGKELVLHEALMVMKSVGLWVCGTVLSGLSGDAKAYMEMKEKAGGFESSPALVDLDSWVCEMVRNRGGVLKEVEELKEAVACLVAAMVAGESSNEAEELQQKLRRFEKMLDGLGKEVDALFAEVLAGRNQLLDGIRPMKH